MPDTAEKKVDSAKKVDSVMQVKTVISPIGIKFVETVNHMPPLQDDDNSASIIKLKVKFNPETGSTVPDETENVELYPLIQSYKDQCGMEYVMKLIRTGYATPEKFADDGKHGGDASGPIDVNDAWRLAEGQKSQLRKTADALGMNIDQNTTDVEIAQRLKSIFEAAQPKAPAAQPSVEKEAK